MNDLFDRVPGLERSTPNDASGHVPARVPLVVWSITGLFVAMLLAYSFLVPTYQAPDEPQHVDLAHLMSEDLTYPRWDDRRLDSGIIRSRELMRFNRRSKHLTVEEAMPKHQVPAIDDLVDESRRTEFNYMPQHPPLYYGAIGGAAWLSERVVGDPLGSFVLETWFYRLMSVLFVAPLPLIIWRTAHWLGAPTPVGVAATLVPLAIPQLLHNGSVVNNDSLMWLLFWSLTPVVLRLARPDVRPRTAVLAGVITGLALLTKGFALALPLWVAAALVVAARRAGGDRRRAVTKVGLVYLATSLAVGGWWWVRNLIVYGHLAPSRFNEIYPGDRTAGVDMVDFLREWAITTRRFWGDFGWYSVRIPAEAVIAASAVCLLGIMVALRRRDPVAHSQRTDRLLLAAPFVLLIGVQGANSLRAYIQVGRLGGMQGRYWFGGLAGIAVVVAIGLATVAGRHVRRLPVAMLAGAGVMQVVAVMTIVGYYWGGPRDGLSERVRALVAWAPLPGELLAVGAAIALLPVALTVVGTVRVARERSGDSDAQRRPQSRPHDTSRLAPRV